MIRLIAALLLLAGCAADEAPAREIVPGQGIGPVALGMRYDELEATVGPLESPSQQNRIVVGRYPELGLEVVLTSGSELEVTGDARVIAVGARATEGVTWAGTPRPGQSLAEIQAALGPAPEVIDDLHYYEAGVSVEVGAGGAELVAVFAPYTLAPLPPEAGR